MDADDHDEGDYDNNDDGECDGDLVCFLIMAMILMMWLWCD